MRRSDRRRSGPRSSRSFACSQGQAYQLEAPTLWDVDFKTAVAQAELEDREHAGAYHRIAFAREDGAVRSRSTPPGPS
jgi:valyl-tRNA synthetase